MSKTFLAAMVALAIQTGCAPAPCDEAAVRKPPVDRQQEVVRRREIERRLDTIQKAINRVQRMLPGQKEGNDP